MTVVHLFVAYTYDLLFWNEYPSLVCYKFSSCEKSSSHIPANASVDLHHSGRATPKIEGNKSMIVTLWEKKKKKNHLKGKKNYAEYVVNTFDYDYY